MSCAIIEHPIADILAAAHCAIAETLHTHVHAGAGIGFVPPFMHHHAPAFREVVARKHMTDARRASFFMCRESPANAG